MFEEEGSGKLIKGTKRNERRVSRGNPKKTGNGEEKLEEFSLKGGRKRMRGPRYREKAGSKKNAYWGGSFSSFQE